MYCNDVAQRSIIYYLLSYWWKLNTCFHEIVCYCLKIPYDEIFRGCFPNFFRQLPFRIHTNICCQWAYKLNWMFIRTVAALRRHMNVLRTLNLGRVATGSRYPVGIYFLKVNNGNTRTICKICLKLTKKTLVTSFCCRYC